MSSAIDVVLRVTTTGMSSFNTVEKNVGKMTRGIRDSFNSLMSINNLIAGAISAGIVKSIYDATVATQALQNKMEAAVGPFTDTRKELAYIGDEAKRVGANYKTYADSYASFAASMLRANVPLEQTRKVFKDISETTTSLHMNADRQKLVFMALEQMASKGVVSMEELRRQLGEHIPGALQIGARAMNMTTQEFMKAVAAGNVMSAEFLPKFAEQVRKELGGSFEEASKSIQANMQRLQSSVFQTLGSIGKLFDSEASQGIGNLAIEMDKLRQNIDENAPAIRAAIFTVIAPVQILWNGFQILADAVDACLFEIWNISKMVFTALIDLIMAASDAVTGYAKIMWSVFTGQFSKVPDIFVQHFGKIKERLKDIGSSVNDTLFDMGAVAKQYWGDFNSNLEDVADSIVKAQTLIEKASYGGSTSGAAGGGRKGGSGAGGGGGGGGGVPLPKSLQKQYDEVMALESRVFNKPNADAWRRGIFGSMEENADRQLNMFLLKYGSFSVQLADMNNQLAMNMSTVWAEFTDSLEYRFKSAFFVLTDLQMSWAQKFSRITEMVYSSAMELLWEYLAAFVKAKFIEGTTAIATEKTKQAENITTAATEGAGAAAASGKAVAGIPYIGPVLAIAAIAAVFGVITSLISKAKGYATGTTNAQPGWHWVGERGPELMNFRGGEQVLSNSASMRAGGGVSVTPTIIIQGNADQGVVEQIGVKLQDFADTLKSAMRKKYLRPGDFAL